MNRKRNGFFIYAGFGWLNSNRDKAAAGFFGEPARKAYGQGTAER